MISDEKMLKIEDVSKIYKLGEIGGTTLRDELQRVWAKIRRKEDPTKKIGSKNYNKGETFKALDNISFEVKKGERVGIIGHNGAGKSTLLKLISRVTGPTNGKIYLNGRVASMLEVGTGFHPELTGRENVYMNGAILGMTKKEIDAKMEDIIEFSEVRQFIDTPVKRYSSGMYVKLAFSVAAHLDSEIVIMDEVLAVGDIAFQNKCLSKMKKISEENEKTVLYVSHNMLTIRKLCNRVIVLKQGKIVFDGDVEKGISIYSGGESEGKNDINLLNIKRKKWIANSQTTMSGLFIDNSTCLFEPDSFLCGELVVNSKHEYKNVVLSAILKSYGTVVTTMFSDPIVHILSNEETRIRFRINLRSYAPGHYDLKFTLSLRGNNGEIEYLDSLSDCYSFNILQKEGMFFNSDWDHRTSGFVVGEKVEISQRD